ncbi:MAG: glycine cleavage system aminomethyltransferase GcvT [Bacteroidota bacterium]
MKTTPLTEIHRQLNAKMADFAGYEMPIVYSNLKEEHHAVRDRAGLFDVSHMGEFIVRGEGAEAFLQYVTTNDLSKLEPGQAQYNCLPNGRGGIVDDLLVYKLPPGGMAMGDAPAYLLVVNASNIQKDWNWLQQHTGDHDVEMIDISEQTALLALQGPLASDILQSLTETDLTGIPYYRFVRGQLLDIENVIISATGYTGSGGFELYFAADKAAEVWEAIMQSGREKGLLPAGLGARDTLRLEKGYCLYGNDIDDTTSPLEAGLGWITKLKKGEFIGRDDMLAEKEAGLKRRLVGFTLSDRRAPRQGYPIVDAEGQQIGQVTSGTHSPSLGHPLGLGYVDVAHKAPGSKIYIDFGRKQAEAEVVKLPFF